MTTMREFVKEHGIKISFQEVSENPYMADGSWDARHYKVRLTCQGRSLTTYFSKGLGLAHGVEAHEVVNALASDASSANSARDWRDFASDMGMEWDSSVENLRSRRQAEEYGMEKDWDARAQAKKTYDACVASGQKLHRLVGDSAYRQLTGGNVEFD